MCYDGKKSFDCGGGFGGCQGFGGGFGGCQGFDCGFGRCCEEKKPEKKPCCCFCCNVCCKPCPPPKPKPAPKPCCIPFWGCFCFNGGHDGGCRGGYEDC